jgi:hypothetical protein
MGCGREGRGIDLALWNPATPHMRLLAGLLAGPIQGRSAMRTSVPTHRRLVVTGLLSILLASLLVLAQPFASSARALPQHCDDLIHGDCENVWFCLVSCFMEMIGLEDFCSQHPEAPQCQ